MCACNGLTGIGDLGVSESVADGGRTPRQTSQDDDVTIPVVDARPDGGGEVVVEVREGGADAPYDAAPDVTVDAACVPSSSGPRYGNVTTGGEMWSSRSGIRFPNDGFYAHTNDNNSTPIKVEDYRFALPANARILGIKVDIARIASATVSDDSIRLPLGDSKANAGNWPLGDNDGPFVTSTYGGPTDTWGAAWTTADINAVTFGVRFGVKGGGDGHVDAVGVTVYYCP